MEYLSNIELYYSTHKNGNRLYISGDEKKHISKVMRHTSGDQLYVTDGKGNIYLSKILNFNEDDIVLNIERVFSYKNTFANYYFCIPKLKNPERFEYALEKCTEMGIVNFIIYNAHHSISKSNKKERWEKISIAAMKQSLLSFKPNLFYVDKLNNLNGYNGIKILFDQDADEPISNFIKDQLNHDQDYYFIFGPEGGLDIKETEMLSNSRYVKISHNRLRSETAIVKTASILTSI